MDDFKQRYPDACYIKVTWGDMDALQHVNNVAYFRYFEDARIEFFNRDFPLTEMYKCGIGPVISENHASYRKPVVYPDTLLVGISSSHIGEDRFTLHYEVFSTQQQCITTTGSSVAVMFDFNQGQKTAIPADLRAILQRLQQ
ncbi:acyl-CoA thioesterase [Shewanella yunxiaonensis]|uniref:Acyl-CoA thioesterase n=1 Tax=Shewanella yunxiaonensis TaxID=2829809 RepID=A0ABX7YUQ5_9GAMM|nr:thioesterase family protein [Shewanella yunxiaonensis]QUN05846.1 acyl-CoA thioesterase [Shewanella yunxiaonensis]